MTDDEKFDYWLDIAQYDLGTADAMLKSGRWLYVVFMCQQAIEKLVKGLLGLYLHITPPRIHDINVLVIKREDKLPESLTDETRKLFARLSAFYLNNRYPEFKAKLSVAINEQQAKETPEQSKEVFSWLLAQKPQSN